MGRVRGLRVGGIDFLSRTVTVEAQRTRGEHGRMVEGDPKWQSQRTIAAPAALMEFDARTFHTTRPDRGESGRACVHVS